MDGLGTYTIATIYASLIVSCLFMPTFLIQRIGLKWTLAFSFSGYIIYTACNFYPSFETLIPAAILLGFGAAPLWSSQSQYLTMSASAMAKIKGGTAQNWVNRFFGSFFFIFQLNQVFGNLISSLIIQGGFPNTDSLPSADEDEVEEIKNRCGLNFQAAEEGSCDTIDPLDDTTVYTLMGIYTGCGVLAFLLVALLVDPLKVPDMEEKGSFWKLAQTTIRHTIKNRNQWLLIPLTIYSGLEQSFMMESFTDWV